MRCTHLGCKAESFVDGKRREMYVVLGGVNNIATVMFGDIFWCEGVIMDIPFHEMILGALVS